MFVIIIITQDIIAVYTKALAYPGFPTLVFVTQIVLLTIFKALIVAQIMISQIMDKMWASLIHL